MLPWGWCWPASSRGALLSGSGVNAGQALIVGLCEKTAKVAAVLWFLRDRRLRTEFDGLLLGAAAGMGFAALETAGYAFETIFQVFQVANQQGASVGQVYADSLRLMLGELHLRMELAVFGHGVWTAIACAAIWRERGDTTFRLTSGVGVAFGIAVVLHAAWDTVASAGGGIVPLVVVGLAGLIILRFFILESVHRAKLCPDAPPPPLWPALRAYLITLFNRVPRPAINLSAFTVGQPPATAPRAAPAPHPRPTPAPQQPAAAAPSAYPPTMIYQPQGSQVERTPTEGSGHSAPALAGAAPPPAEQPASPRPSAVRCAVCGTKAAPTATFCSTCGSALSVRKQGKQGSAR